MMMPGASRGLPDEAEARRLLEATGGRIVGPLHWLRDTSSTNDEAKHAAKAGAPHGSIWVAETQRAGRGRQGRSWLGTAGESLLCSFLLRLPCAPGRVPLVSLVAGLAVRDAVSACVPGAQVMLKWPNDVWIDRKKVAGILVESSLRGRQVESVVVGIGVNVLTRVFPDELASIATSCALAAAPGQAPPSRAQLLAGIAQGLDRDVEHVVHRGAGIIRARLEAHDALRGLPVASEAGEGVASGIDDEGKLLVQRADGVLCRWNAGEVHLRPALPPSVSRQ
jgi:BirA family biotin operon repressor/biotin-[acetyl-CoA-carboxylase] ligase